MSIDQRGSTVSDEDDGNPQALKVEVINKEKPKEVTPYDSKDSDEYFEIKISKEDIEDIEIE